MAATKTKQRTEPHERGGRALKHQPNRFLGLFLAPFAGLLTSWLIHVWTLGVNIHWGPISWVVHASAAAPYVAVCLITLATVGLSWLAWRFTEHRDIPKRAALAGSVALVGAMFAINAGTGPHYWWSGLFVIAGWTVAIAWSIARLDVARNDKSFGDEEREDTFLEKVGLKGWHARKVTRKRDENGRITATEVEMQHAQGDVVDQLQDAVPNIESATAAPAGLSRAVATERADRSVLTILHEDPLKDIPVLPEPSAPGGSVTEAFITGKYSNGEWLKAYLAGNPDLSITPSSYLFMGMTRTGKTTCENGMLTEAGTRRDVVILYLNKAKGFQDWRAICPITEAAVIADEAGQSALYREAMQQIKRIMAYRQRQLALFGISEWTAECHSAPPWRTDPATGKRVQMEPMPFLICHFGEADAILENDRGDSVFLASKGLSLGVCTGWSLQRADHTKMPTGLRFNLGTSWCFGCGDDESVSFALSDNVIKAGAHPEYWKQSKPGYHYYQGLGVDDSLFPVHGRSFGKGPDGEKITEALLKRNLEYGPRMARLDRGSADATRYPDRPDEPSWWDKTVAETDRLRDELLGRKSAAAPATASAYESPQPGEVANEDEISERDSYEEMREEVRNTTHVEGIELYPDLGDGNRASIADATADLGKAPDDEGLSWGDDRPAPRDRQAAIAGLRATLLELTGDESLLDKDDPDGRTYIITTPMIVDRYPFRSRPWLVEAMIGMSTGDIDGPAGWVLSRAPDLGARRAVYRLQRVPDGHGE